MAINSIGALRYNNSNGDVSISTTLQDGREGCIVKDSTWTTGWTSFMGYYTGGDPHLLLQKKIQERLKFIHWIGMHISTQLPKMMNGVLVGILLETGKMEIQPISFIINQVLLLLVWLEFLNSRHQEQPLVVVKMNIGQLVGR